MNNPEKSHFGHIIKYYYECLQHQTEEQPEQTLEEWKLIRLAVIRAAFNDLPKEEKRVIMLSFFYNLPERHRGQNGNPQVHRQPYQEKRVCQIVKKDISLVSHRRCKIE